MLKNVFSWLWIALFWEFFYQLVVGGFKACKSLDDKSLKDSEDNKNENNTEDIPKKRRFYHRKVGKGLTGLANELKSIFDDKEDNTTNIAQDDPLVKDGLRREDKIVSGGNVKVSSYFDQDGKMVFQRETILPPPTINDIKNDSKVNNPSFYIKPQDGALNVEEQVEKRFGKIYGVGKELGDSQKDLIDGHIEKTFKDIYDMVLPSVY